MEKVFLDLSEEHVGTITEKLSIRKGRMLNLQNNGFGRVLLEFVVPSRGLIGFRNQFLTETKGSGIMNSLFDGYSEWTGNIPQRTNGVLIADRKGKIVGGFDADLIGVSQNPLKKIDALEDVDFVMKSGKIKGRSRSRY